MKTKTYTCLICGKEFQATQPAKYCSPACKSTAANHATVTKPCVVCGEMFTSRKNNKAKFCSSACRIKAHKIVEQDPNNPLAAYITTTHDAGPVVRYCIMCGKPFETQSRSEVNRRCPDCQKEYSRLYNLGAFELLEELNSKRYKIGELEPMIEKVLADAGISVAVSDAQEAKSYAQSPDPVFNKTREEHNAKRRARRAMLKALGKLAGKEHDRTGYRDVTFERLGTKCLCCGYDAYFEALQVHHIDMNRENNAPENLTVLCSNCHAVLHKRIKQNMSLYPDKIQGIKDELEALKAEVKERKQAGIPDKATRTEGSEESESGATHSDTSSTDMNHHEAAPDTDSWDIQPDLGF